MPIKSGWPLALALSALSLAARAKADADPGSAPLPADVAPAASVAPAAMPADPVPPPSDADAPREASRNRLIEEVVVTAQKREENLQDVPISVTAFSAAALDAKGLDDPKSLAQSTPGVYYGQTVNFAVIYIRGVGSDAFLPDSDPSVASYIDGIYFPFANGLSQSFGAVERVEVLKGPQGTLFGRNSTGGAFNTITKSPGREPEVSVLTSYASYDQVRTRAYLSLPFGKSFAASVSATYNNEDNYYKGSRGSGVGTGSVGLPQEVGKGVRLKTKWDVSDDLDINLNGFKFRQTGLSSTALPNVSPSLATTLVGTLRGVPTKTPEGEYEVHVDVPSYFSVDNKVVYAQINYRPEWFDVKLLGSKQKIESDNVYDFDGSEAPFITFDAKNQFADVKTAELQILSNKEYGPDWLTYIVGAFYLDQESGFPLNRLSVGSLDFSEGNVFGVIPFPTQLRDFLAQFPLVPDGASVGLVSLLGTKSTAFFTQETIDFTDWLHFTFGGRYQKENRGVIESSASLVNLNGTTTPIPSVPPAPPHAHTHNFSPKVVLGVNPAEDVLVYASYAEGYKSGTFNTVNVYNAPEYVRPETVKTYELGLKSELFDKLLRFNGALFQNKIDDLQVQFISLLSGGAVSLENAGGAKIQGAEFDFQLTPLADLDPGLVIGGGITYLDSKYTKYERASGYSVNAQGDYEGAGVYNFRTGDNKGNQVTRTPKYSGTFSLNQIISFDRGDVEIGASVYYNDGFYYLAANTPVSRQDSYYVVDAQISYLYRAWNTRWTLFGKNLNDEQYTYSQFHTDAGRQDYLAPPRTYGVRFNWDF